MKVRIPAQPKDNVGVSLDIASGKAAQPGRPVTVGGEVVHYAAPIASLHSIAWSGDTQSKTTSGVVLSAKGP